MLQSHFTSHNFIFHVLQCILQSLKRTFQSLQCTFQSLQYKIPMVKKVHEGNPSCTYD